MMRNLRDAGWLTADRAQSYMLVLGVALIVFMLGAFGNILKPAVSDPQARPMAADFDAFWSGASLALHGHAAQAYDGPAIGQAEAVGAELPPGQILPYLYPPVFLLLCLPLAAFPYLIAMPVFLGLGFVGNALLLRRLLPQRWALLPIWVLPGAVMNAVIGQNGFVSAAAFGGAMLLLERWPIAAGACLGLFAYKPHLALCIPVALAAARRFSAFFACAASAALLTGASWLVLGTGAWMAFFAHAHVLRAVLASPEVWPKLVSVYAAIRLLHGGTNLAFAGQAIVSVFCLVAVAYVCAARPGGRAEMATLIVAALLCTPYAMDYDLVCLGLPMAWLAGAAVRDGWRPWEKFVALACFVLPLFARGLNLGFGVPLAPFCLAGLLGCVVSRARARKEPAQITERKESKILTQMNTDKTG
jgi:hypothetical protein